MITIHKPYYLQSSHKLVQYYSKNLVSSERMKVFFLFKFFIMCISGSLGFLLHKVFEVSWDLFNVMHSLWMDWAIGFIRQVETHLQWRIWAWRSLSPLFQCECSLDPSTVQFFATCPCQLIIFNPNGWSMFLLLQFCLRSSKLWLRFW